MHPESATEVRAVFFFSVRAYPNVLHAEMVHVTSKKSQFFFFCTIIAIAERWSTRVLIGYNLALDRVVFFFCFFFVFFTKGGGMYACEGCMCASVYPPSRVLNVRFGCSTFSQ